MLTVHADPATTVSIWRESFVKGRVKQPAWEKASFKHLVNRELQTSELNELLQSREVFGIRFLGRPDHRS